MHPPLPAPGALTASAVLSPPCKTGCDGGPGGGKHCSELDVLPVNGDPPGIMLASQHNTWYRAVQVAEEGTAAAAEQQPPAATVSQPDSQPDATFTAATAPAAAAATPPKPPPSGAASPRPGNNSGGLGSRPPSSSNGKVSAAGSEAGLPPLHRQSSNLANRIAAFSSGVAPVRKGITNTDEDDITVEEVLHKLETAGRVRGSRRRKPQHKQQWKVVHGRVHVGALHACAHVDQGEQHPSLVRVLLRTWGSLQRSLQAV